MDYVELPFGLYGTIVPHRITIFSSRGSTYAIYIFSSDFLQTLNLRARRRFDLVQALTEMFLMWSDQLQELESVSPRCLWLFVSWSIVSFIKRGGWGGEIILLEIIIGSLLLALKLTNQSSAHWEIVFKSAFNTKPLHLDTGQWYKD